MLIPRQLRLSLLPTLGDNVGLIDQSTAPLDLTLNLTNTVDLTGGNTVSIDFDVAARRVNGNAKTIFVDALDSSGNIVTRFVLGDTNSFGNAAADRQRPGYDPGAPAGNTDNSLFAGPGTPGAFWWGSDSNSADFNVDRDAHMSLVISDSSFDFSTTSQTGATYSQTAINNYNNGTFTEIAEVRLTSVGANHGMYFDNIVVDGVVIPEPSSALGLLSLCALGFAIIRRRRKVA